MCMASTQGKVDNLYRRGRKIYDKQISSPFEIIEEAIYQEIYKKEVRNKSEPTGLRFRFRYELRRHIESGNEKIDVIKLKAVIKKGLAKPLQEYQVGFLFPLRLKLNESLPFKSATSKRFNARLQVATYEHFFRKFDRQAAVRDYSKHFSKEQVESALQHNFCFIIVALRATDADSATKNALQTYEAIAHSYNAAQNLYKRSLHLGSLESKPEGSFCVPCFAYCKDLSTDKVLDYQVSGTPQLRSSETATFNKNHLSLAKRYLRILNKSKPTPIEQRLSNCIEQFSEGTMATKRTDKIMRYWRVIEFGMTDATEMMYEKEMVKTLKQFFYNDPDKQLMGDLVVKMRNDLIHRDIFTNTQGDNYVWWTKEYAAATLQVLGWLNTQKIGAQTSTEIDEFFQIYKLQNSSLKNAIKLRKNRLS